MPYNNVISRSDAAALIPEEAVSEIIQRLPEQSATMGLFRRLNMSRGQLRIPVLAALPVAYFVNPGDTGLKETTEAGWANKFLNAEEIACIAPIPETVLDDADYDVWSEITPFIVEAIGRTLDAAVFFGVGKPASWPVDISTRAIAQGNVFTRGTQGPEDGGVHGDISELFSLVEGKGYDINGVMAHRRYKGLLRNARATTGQQLAAATSQEGAQQSVYGIPVNYPLRGLWPTPANSPEMVVGDFTEGIFAIRSDFTYKVLDQAVIQNATGVIQFNLAQQDMVALRVTLRCAFQVAETLQPEAAANAYPFGVMRSA